MPAEAPQAVESLCVQHVYMLQDLRDGAAQTWNDYKVDVVAHQAVGEHIEAATPGVLAQPGQICPEVGIRIEDLGLAVSPLSDMVRDVWNYIAGCPRHGCKRKSARTTQPDQYSATTAKKGSVPF